MLVIGSSWDGIAARNSRGSFAVTGARRRRRANPTGRR